MLTRQVASTQSPSEPEPLAKGKTETAGPSKGKVPKEKSPSVRDIENFRPDVSLLYRIMKDSKSSSELANKWFEQFVVVARSIATPATGGAGWLFGPGTHDTNGEPKKRKRAKGASAPPQVLDEAAVLRCRFASALSELQRSGILRCYNSGADEAAVVVERAIYAWV
jgi:hypothetical protein